MNEQGAMIDSLAAIATKLHKWDNIYAWRMIRAWEASGTLTPEQEGIVRGILDRYRARHAT